MARRKPTRGWIVESGLIIVTNQDVDNVLSEQSALIAGEQLDDANQALSGDDSEYYVKRIILDLDVVCLPAALNQSGQLPFNIGVFVIDEATTDFVTSSAPLNIEILVDYDVLLQTAARVLHVDSRWAYAQSASGEPPTAFPDAAAMYNRWTVDLSFKGGVNVRSSQQLSVCLGQAEWHLQQWINGDSIQLDYVARMLVQERRQR